MTRFSRTRRNEMRADMARLAQELGLSPNFQLRLTRNGRPSAILNRREFTGGTDTFGQPMMAHEFLCLDLLTRRCFRFTETTPA